MRILIVQGEAVTDPTRLSALFDRLYDLTQEYQIGGASTPVVSSPVDLRAPLHIAAAEARAGCALRRPNEHTLLELVTRSAPIGATELAENLLDRLRRNDSSGILTTTVKALIECGGQRGPTAEKLQIHRNTLTERLRRVRIITDWDLDDGETHAALAIALRLVKI